MTPSDLLAERKLWAERRAQALRVPRLIGAVIVFGAIAADWVRFNAGAACVLPYQNAVETIVLALVFGFVVGSVVCSIPAAVWERKNPRPKDPFDTFVAAGPVPWYQKRIF